MSVVPQVAFNPSPVRLKRRRWYLAALLSFMCPGLGQLYNGQVRRGLTLFALLELLMLAAILLSYGIGGPIAVFVALIAALALTVGMQLLATIDAALQAWRHGAIELRRYHHPWVYLAAIGLAAIANDVAISHNGIGNWNIPAGSMIPTLQVGDRFVAEKNYFLRHAPERGELALFKLPTDPRVDYIKRVVGLPGDTIQMIGGQLHINGVATARERIDDAVETYGAATVRIRQFIEVLPGGRSYRIREERGDEGRFDNTPPYLVPADRYFVLGDNRDNSQDSRVLSEVGFIPRANFRDRPAYVYWSRDRARIGVHLE